MAGFAVLQFIYGAFVPGRAPAWPVALPGQLPWAYASGAILVVIAAAIAFDQRAREAAMLLGAMVFVWALVRHLPLVAANPHGSVLTKAGKAIALFGGAFAIAGSFPPSRNSNGALGRTINAADGYVLLGRMCLGAFMILGGTQHFLFTNFVAMLIPAWIPGHLFWTYLAGSALIAGGIGLMIPVSARLAGTLSGVMMFLWVVLLHVPRAMVATAPQRQNEWTAVFEAMTMSGIAFVIAGYAKRNVAHSPP